MIGGGRGRGAPEGEGGDADDDVVAGGADGHGARLGPDFKLQTCVMIFGNIFMKIKQKFLRF
jgi:hypothetical protein